MYDEHHIFTSVVGKLLETQVAQVNDIGEGVFTKPHTIVVDILCGLVGHCHCASIDLKSHSRFYLVVFFAKYF